MNIPPLPDRSIFSSYTAAQFDKYPRDIQQDLFKLAREKERQWKRYCLRSTFLTAKYALPGTTGQGYDRVKWVPNGELCWMLDNPYGKRHKLILLPRSTFKTTLGTITYPIRKICLNPDIKILVVHKNEMEAKKKLQEVRLNLEHDAFRRDIMDHVGDSTKGWRADSIRSILTKSTSGDPTLTITSIDSAPPGAHYDLIIFDDIHDEINSDTPEKCEKVRQRAFFITNMSKPGAQFIFIGTRYSEADTYGFIIDCMKDEKGEPLFDIIVRSAYNSMNPPRDPNDNSLYFEEELSHEKLAFEKKGLTLYQFNCNYLNVPAGGKDEKKIPSNFQYRSVPVDKVKNGYTVMAVDPAGDPSAISDEWGFVIGNLDYDANEIDILEAYRKKIYTDDLYEEIQSMRAKYPLDCIRIEEKEREADKKKLVELYMRLEKDVFYIEAVPPGVRKSKEKRDEDILRPPYVYRIIFHAEHLKGGQLEQEIDVFPYGKSNHIIDAEAYVVQKLMERLQPVKRVVEPEPLETREDIWNWFRRKHGPTRPSLVLNKRRGRKRSGGRAGI